MRVVTRAKLPTRSGSFDLVAFAAGEGDLPHLALVRGGDLRGAIDVPVSVHAQCLTGDALGSVRCDCRSELEAAMDGLAEQGRGVLVYLRQEGRGVGLSDEPQGYLDAAAMLRALGITSVVLFTGGPKVLAGLAAGGVSVASQLAGALAGRPSAA